MIIGGLLVFLLTLTVGQDPPSPVIPCSFGSDCGDVNTQVDDLNLPPSIDTGQTISGTAQGIVNQDGTYQDGLTSIIITNRTKAFLNCTSGSMNVNLKFREPFWGIIYADFNRDSSCSVLGTGGLDYVIDLPLRGCGTVQVRTEHNEILS